MFHLCATPYSHYLSPRNAACAQQIISKNQTEPATPKHHRNPYFHADSAFATTVVVENVDLTRRSQANMMAMKRPVKQNSPQYTDKLDVIHQVQLKCVVRVVMRLVFVVRCCFVSWVCFGICEMWNVSGGPSVGLMDVYLGHWPGWHP